MEPLVIHAANRESAEGFSSALSGFGAKLVKATNGRWQVEIPLEGSDQEIIDALNRIEAYVSMRGDGPARLDLDGHQYTLHPTDVTERLFPIPFP